MIAREAMNDNLTVVETSESLNSLETTARNALPECLAVKNGKNIIGLIRGENILKLLAGKATSISEIIETQFNTINENSFLDELIVKMAKQKYAPTVVTNHKGYPIGYLEAETFLDFAFREIVKLYSIIKAIPIGVIAIDKHGSVSIVNQAAEDMLKIKAEDCIGQHISRINHSIALVDVLNSGKAEPTHKARAGDLTLVVNRNPIRYRNNIIGAVEVFQDISDLENLSYELETVKTLNEELETIIRSSYDELYVTDGKGVTLKVSDSASKTCGVPPEFFIGKSVEDLEKEGLFVPSATKKAIAQKEIVTVNSITNLGKQIVTTATPVLNEQGDVVKVICNVRDFTELSRLKQRLEETESMAQNYRLKLAEYDAKRAKLDGIIGVSPQITEIKKMICKIADLDSNIFITGESGVGKGIIARAIHAAGQRSDAPFITVNCGAIPENLVESELFGYDPGAFTGAVKSGKKGLVELASGGTLFLDEIAEMPLNLQAKLLAFIQDKKYLRVGGNKEIEANVRIIAATNKNRHELITKGKLREDLYYRLNVVHIHIPPLRERREDIGPLVEYKLTKLNEHYQTHKVLKPETKDILYNYEWKGNVRELENVLERMIITSETYEIQPESLPDYIHTNDENKNNNLINITNICKIEEAVSEVEKQLLQKARLRFKTTTKMAEALGVNQSTIVRKLKRHKIS